MNEPRDDRIRQAVELLGEALGERVRHHPLGHLMQRRGELQLGLALPLVGSEAGRRESARALREEIDEALAALLRHLQVFRPGRVWCLRCQSADCEHAAQRACTEVFAGYSPSGVPRFAELGQWLLERREPRVDQIYRKPPELVAHVTDEEELTADLLPVFRDADTGHRIHGQVAAGFYPARDAGGIPQPIALTFQVVSSGSDGKPRHFGLNLLGMAPGGEPLEVLFDRTGEIPWRGPADWAQKTLKKVESWAARRPGKAKRHLDRRLAGLVKGLARRLEKGRRARRRKTRHGRKRHADRRRPTWKAMADLEAARDDQVLYDERNETLVVLGERGRAHVFNPAGRLVTSVRYAPASIERKRRQERWQEASREQIEELRKRAEAPG